MTTLSKTIRSVARCVAIALLLAIFALESDAVWQTSARQSPSRKPNVLLIVVDDLRNSLSCYGDALVKSPNVDRLARRGMRFDRAYCQYPVCNPSRTSFLTGLRPDTTRVLDNNTQFRRTVPDVVTLPELFKQNGYYTASLGKIFHRGLTMEDVRAEMDDQRSWAVARYFSSTPTGLKGEGRNLTDGRLQWCRWLAAEGTDEDQPDGQIAAEAVRLLEETRDQPLFLAVGFHKPHDPFIAPRKYFDLYPLDKLPLAADAKDRSAEQPLAIPGGFDFSKFTDRERREFKRSYLAGISFMDAQLGKLLDAMDRKRLWENTVVVFLGDHGYHLGERGWWNKNTLFELSARAPLIVYSPKMKAAGRSSERLVEFVDLYPTITELGGLTAPGKLEGLSFRPLLDNPRRAWKKAAFTQVRRGKDSGYTVRTERWRYTEWAGGARGVEFYDHSKDPNEFKNLAADPAHAKVAAEMKKLLADGWKAALPPT